MSRRSSTGSTISLCSSPASTPASASRSTCASVSDLSPPLGAHAVEGLGSSRLLSSSLLARVGHMQVNLGNGAERPQQASEEAPQLVQQAFGRYGSVGHGGTLRMSSQAFAALCSDSGLVDERMGSHVNLIFARVTRPGFVMDSTQLAAALELVAKRKGCAIGAVHEAIRGISESPVRLPFDFDPLEELPSMSENNRHYTLSCIEKVLVSGEALLLKGRWLLELCGSGGILPRRDDLPEKAIWTPKIVMQKIQNYHASRSKVSGAVLTVAVSCFWLTLQHPDPHGQHLRALCQNIQKRLAKCGNSSRPIDDLAVFWDYACLPQGMQREDQIVPKEELELGLDMRKLWHDHPNVERWILTETSPGISACVKSCAS